MSKTRQSQRKKARLAQERARALMPKPGLDLSKLQSRVMTFMETESDRIIDERLAKKFGAKDHYEDWEVEEAFEELHAENALPDLSHLD
jgi:hypothetical protein